MASRKKAARYANRDAILRAIGFASYPDYLASPLWSEIRTRILDRDEGLCRLCNAPAVSVHHITYRKDVLIGKNDSQLASICRGCHKSIEFDLGKKLTSTTKIATKSYKRSIRKLGGKASKARRNKMRPICACCGEKHKKLGRNDVCMDCYKSGRAIEFARANPEIAPNYNRVPESKIGTTT